VIYTDHDPFVCKWLEHLVADGHLPAGRVVCADVRDVEPAETTHWFAGIGGWPLALELAGWRGQVWTASLPCQPFSTAGRRKGTDDERHLWPAFREHVAKHRPSTVFGEQVASPAGRAWFAAVRDDMEARREGRPLHLLEGGQDEAGSPTPRRRKARRVGEPDGEPARRDAGASSGAEAGGHRARLDPWGLGHAPGSPGAANWVLCRDGKLRPLGPGIEPLVDGLPGRVGRLRAYGNAIVPQVAAAFIEAVTEGDE